MEIHDVVIIGTGPAGLTAAIYAARASLNPVIYAGSMHGGQLTTTTEIENFPGFEHGIMGPKLMSDMTAQAERFGTKIIYETITKIDASKRPFKLWTHDTEFQAQTVIIATGATAKTLGLPDEAKLMGRGLSTCATCDGFFYKNKIVAVTGGGDSAMEEANYLSKLASKVYLIHRRPEFRASKIMVDRVKANPKIQMMIPYAVERALSDQSGVNGLMLKNLESNKVEELKVDGLFMAIGHKPNSDIFLPWVDVDSHGYIKTTNHTATKTPGLFAAGDIGDPNFKQAITAAGMGCQAAMQAQKYLEGHS
ncbi:MAG: thioredoxin-disulfide reductase [Proteobacteria bacterium]|nr:thioredoxin-disulfide reductase [Pseudomonadota bacterium]